MTGGVVTYHMRPDLAKSNFNLCVGCKLYRMTKRRESSPVSNSPKSISSREKAASDPLSLRLDLHLGRSS